MCVCVCMCVHWRLGWRLFSACGVCVCVYVLLDLSSVVKAQEGGCYNQRVSKL